MDKQWTVFGERLRAELERQGMSYRTFSAKVGLTLTTTCRRAEEYSDVCLAITAEMAKGIKFDSIRIDENGIAFGKERPERKVGKWTEDNACEFCGFKPWYERDIHTLSYCPNCGADMRGKK